MELNNEKLFLSELTSWKKPECFKTAASFTVAGSIFGVSVCQQGEKDFNARVFA